MTITKVVIRPKTLNEERRSLNQNKTENDKIGVNLIGDGRL